MIRQAALADLLLVAESMRPEHRRDMAAWYPDLEIDSFVADRWNHGGMMWSMWADDVPFAVGGVGEDRPGVGTWWLIGTPSLEKHALAVVRFGRTVVNRLLASDFHRIQAYCLEDWPAACRTAEAIGLAFEGRHPAMGVNGENVLSYGRTRNGQSGQQRR